MNIKEVAQMFDVTPETIRYYEKIGVIPPIERDEKGYRIFGKKDLNWIFLAKSLRNAGLTIESIISFATLSQKKGDERREQKDILKAQLTELDAKLKEMQRTRDLLAYKIETYDEHLAKFNAGTISESEIEELWKMKNFTKHSIK